MHQIQNLAFSLVFLVGFVAESFSQEIPIGAWRDHLSYSNAISVTAGNGLVYCASSSGVFSYDVADNSIERLNPISGLSDIGIATIKFNNHNNKLIIAYENGNIDIVSADKQITNLSFIKTSNIIADKTINHITMVDKNAYLATGFGVVVVDTDKEEVVDTYYFGPLGSYVYTNAVAFDNQNIYAATNQGVYYADKNSANLADYNEWSFLSDLGLNDYTQMEFFAGKLILGLDNSGYNTDSIYSYESGVSTKLIPHGINLTQIATSNNKLTIAGDGATYIYNSSFAQEYVYYTYNSQFTLNASAAYIDHTNDLWVADRFYGLIRFYDQWSGEIIVPNGPTTPNAFRMSFENGTLWITSGGYQENVVDFPYNYRENYEWKTAPKRIINPDNGQTLSKLVSAAINPTNTSQVYVGAWGNGLLEFNNGSLTKVHTAQNAPLDSASFGITAIGAMMYDKNNNLWIASSYSTNVLSVKTPDNQWYNYSFQGFTLGDSPYQKLLVDANSFVWLVDAKYNKIKVFNANGTLDNTSDDQLIEHSGFGTATIVTFEEDQNGEIWFGTSAGIGVLSTPSEVFNSSQTIEPIYIQQDGQTQKLLESQYITSIAIDGANRKWIGTQNAGIYLMSDDGTQEISHFTTQNSPLFSDNIFDIEIDGRTGEVYIATEKGLISYKGTATESNENFDHVFVYPNPVKPGYNGVIAIRGLTFDTDIKITDISGNMVFETKSLGGQAIWDGNDLNGNRVKSGVYMVFNATEDGELKKATKILFIH